MILRSIFNNCDWCSNPTACWWLPSGTISHSPSTSPPSRTSAQNKSSLSHSNSSNTSRSIPQKWNRCQARPSASDPWQNSTRAFSLNYRHSLSSINSWTPPCLFWGSFYFSSSINWAQLRARIEEGGRRRGRAGLGLKNNFWKDGYAKSGCILPWQSAGRSTAGMCFRWQ